MRINRFTEIRPQGLWSDEHPNDLPQRFTNDAKPCIDEPSLPVDGLEITDSRGAGGKSGWNPTTLSITAGRVEGCIVEEEPVFEEARLAHTTVLQNRMNSSVATTISIWATYDHFPILSVDKTTKSYWHPEEWPTKK